MFRRRTPVFTKNGAKDSETSAVQNRIKLMKELGFTEEQATEEQSLRRTKSYGCHFTSTTKNFPRWEREERDVTILVGNKRHTGLRK